MVWNKQKYLFPCFPLWTSGFQLFPYSQDEVRLMQDRKYFNLGNVIAVIPHSTRKCHSDTSNTPFPLKSWRLHPIFKSEYSKFLIILGGWFWESAIIFVWLCSQCLKCCSSQHTHGRKLCLEHLNSDCWIQLSNFLKYLDPLNTKKCLLDDSKNVLKEMLHSKTSFQDSLEAKALTKWH